MTDETVSPEVAAAPAEEAPIVQAAEAVAETVANPSLPVVVEDLVLVHGLVNEVKAKLAGKHLSLGLIFQTLFNLV